MSVAGRLSGFSLSAQNARLGARIRVPGQCCWPIVRAPIPSSPSLLPAQTARCFTNFGRDDADIRLRLRSGTTTPSGAILPEPKRARFGLLSVVTAVVTGLLIGATLSKLMANFLEEKELFVPSDDDDDDDDDD